MTWIRRPMGRVLPVTATAEVPGCMVIPAGLGGGVEYGSGQVLMSCQVSMVSTSSHQV